MKKVSGHRYLARRGDILYFRRGVPRDVREAFGGRPDVWTSLKTSSVPVARSRLQRHVDGFEAKLALARNEVAPAKIASAPYAPTASEIEVRVRAAFKERVDRVRSVRKSDRRDVQAAHIRLEDLTAFQSLTAASRGLGSVRPPMDVQWQCEALCERFGWSLDEESELWWRLVDMVTRSQVEAAERQMQTLKGDPASVTDLAFSPDQLIQDAREESEGSTLFGAPVSLLGLFEEYVREREPSPATVKSFRAKVRSFKSFLGHDDARRITKRDVALWKDKLLASGQSDGSPLSAKTVRETYLSAVKSTLRRGVDSGQLHENVASGVSVVGPKRAARLRPAGFTDDEARQILEATLTEHRRSLSKGRRLARRWLPWLCAYTGARVDEMAQLRAEDVALRDGIWSMRITPEAGGTKDGNARVVALHPHLIEQGFLGVVEGKTGPIFYDPSLSRGGSLANRQSKKVGEHVGRWVRKEIGITDLKVAPNHGWRHRFKTIARDCRMVPEVRDYIQGHVPRNESEGYGDTSPRATFEEIRRIPKIEVTEP